MKKVAIKLLKTYKKLITPVLKTVLGNGCRYSPTCSDYSAQAVDKFGVVKGSMIALRRISSCHPYSKRSMIAATWDIF